MKKLLLLLSVLPLISFAQNEFYNDGAEIYIQPGALIHVQGSVVNDNAATTSRIFNNGILEISQSGNLTNVVAGGNEFRTYSGYTGGERAVKFVGNGTQTISGNFNSANARIYNLIIDKASTGARVDLNTSVQVDGSLVFGSNITSVTYTPTPASILTNNAGLGILRVPTGPSNRRLVINNPDPGAIANFAALDTSSNPTDRFIQTEGIGGGSQDGLHRAVEATYLGQNYVFPLGSSTKGYQPFRMNFSAVPSGTSYVMSKFLSQNAANYPVNILQSCTNCGIYPTPANSGFNYFVPSAQLPPCYTNPDGQWVILENAVQNHGVWVTNDASGNNTQYQYLIETFPTRYYYTEEGGILETFRTVYKGADYIAGIASYEASTMGATDFTNNLANGPQDLVQYSAFGSGGPTPCYTGTGIPGGIYNDLRGGFFLAKSKSNNALPVELLYLNAYPVNNQFIQVSWATALEINNDGFFVERSTDGINFSTIGWVEGNDNTTTTHYYTFDDVNVAPNVVYYYRLKQMDNDGAFEYTYIVNAMITSGEVFNISEFIPNPAQDLTKLIVTTSSNVDINVKLFGVLGQVLSEKDYSLTAGSSNLDFDIRNYAEGTYTALITANNKVYSKKLVVTHR